MKNKKKERLIIFLQRAQMHLFWESSNKVLSWDFDPALVSDLEIVNEEKFHLALDSFVKPLKLNGGEAIVLLDTSVYFTKKLDEQSEMAVVPETESIVEDDGKPGLIEKVNLEEEKKLQFMQSMPFSNVFATVLTLGKEKVVFSLNRDFYEPFIKEFTDNRYEVTYIYPISVVSSLFGEGGFTVESAKALITSADKFKMFNFLQAPLKKEIGSVPITTMMPDNSERKRLYVLLGAFIVLLLLLVGVFFWARERDQLPVPPDTVIETAVTPTDIESHPQVTSSEIATFSAEIPIESSESAVLAVSNLTLDLRNATGSEVAAAIVQERLQDLGFVAISVTEIAQQSADNALVIIKPTVDDDVRQLIQNELINLGYSVAFQESSEITSDISITLTNQ